VISVDVTFFESTSYFAKETFKSSSLKPEDHFIFFLENSSSSYVNVDLMPQRYRHVYIRRAQSSTYVPVVPVSLITDMIPSENVVVSSPFIDIDFCVDIDSQSDLDIPIAHRKRKKSCTLRSLHNFLFYAHLHKSLFCYLCDFHPFPKFVVKSRLACNDER